MEVEGDTPVTKVPSDQGWTHGHLASSAVLTLNQLHMLEGGRVFSL